MNLKSRNHHLRTFVMVALALAIPLVLNPGNALATIQYLDDGAIQNAQGGWDLPAQGTCPADLTKTTRPDCIALRLNYATSALCTAAGTGGANRSWSTGVCNDLVNTTQATCQAQQDRLWNASPTGTDTCAIVMKGDDRNDVVCVQHGGTWVTSGACIGSWIMPARTAYTPPLLTSNGTGDQCLRCHNAETQYNGPRVRDTENTLYQGHKNMARKVAPVGDPAHGLPWGGPPFSCSNATYTDEQTCEENGAQWNPTIYPNDDSGNVFDWPNGQATMLVGGAVRQMTWIYGDWLSPFPRAIYKAPASTTSKTCTNPLYLNQATCEAALFQWVLQPGASYSCARCHTTGWTSDAAINAGLSSVPVIEGKEPENSFSGLTWNRNGDAPANVVNLTGGVSGDGNKYSSWDLYGITCSRCHSSAIDTTTASTATPPQYSAPAGMSAHHNNLTAADANNGVCSNSQWTAETQCTANGGTWLNACSVTPPAACTLAAANATDCATALGTWFATPFCSNAYYNGDQAGCTANGFTWTEGWCKGADPTGTTCAAGTYRAYFTQQACQVAVPTATWSFSKCSVEGACNKGTCSNVTYGDKISCEANGATWTPITTLAACTTAGGQYRYATDIVRCIDVGGKWSGNNTNRGQIISAVCMQCHRQETAGVPFPNTPSTTAPIPATPGDYTYANPGMNLKAGPYHGSYVFLSHPQGNQFLNSPHARFTGNFNQIATAKNFAGYQSFFMFDGEAANTGNGCTGCHDVHESVVEETSPFPAIHEECTECHAGPYNKDLTKINHLWGAGTPMENAATEPAEACEICHMPDAMHMFRINPDASYSTFPAAAITATTQAQCTAIGGAWANLTATGGGCTVNANAATEGAFGSAVWVDVDHACGQCHGGGSSRVITTGSINANTKILTVAAGTGALFAPGQRVQIADAGALDYDDVGAEVNSDFESYVVSVVGDTVNLVGAPPFTVANKAVVQNPTTNDAPYYTKSQLGGVALGMHAAAGVNYQVSFTTAIDPANSLKVNVVGSVNCGNDPCPSLNYDWNWGDSSAAGSGASANHTYALPGTYSITLTVRLTAIPPNPQLEVGSSSRSVTVSASWPVTFTTAIDPLNYLQVTTTATVNCGSLPCPPTGSFTYDWSWGDGSAHGTVNPGTHTYASTGTKTIVLTVRLSPGGALIGTVAKNVKISVPVAGPPVANATCTWTANTWTMGVDDTTSTGGQTPLQTVVDWGDGSSKTIITGLSSSLSHKYNRTGTFSVSVTVNDKLLRSSTYTCTTQATPAYFTISGSVKTVAKAGISGASVLVKLGATPATAITVGTFYTSPAGVFTTGATLAPGTYNLVIKKSGYSFPAPGDPGNPQITVGPNPPAPVVITPLGLVVNTVRTPTTSVYPE